MNKKTLNRTHAIVTTAMLCQDFVLEDFELMKDSVIKENLDNPAFWYDVGESTLCAIEGLIAGKYRKGAPSDMDFLFDTNNRLEINDIILQSLTVAIKNINNED